MTKKSTHTGTVENYNYGAPYTYKVELYETNRFWIAVNKHGNMKRYRKGDGSPTGRDMWDQNRLQLDTIQPTNGA